MMLPQIADQHFVLRMDAEDGHDALGLRAICQDVDNFGVDLYYENDYHSCFNDFGFFLSRPN